MTQPATPSVRIAQPDPADQATAPVDDRATGSEGARPAAPAGAADPVDGQPHAPAGFWTLAVGSVGVVYGDIGTSPLYAFREALVPARYDNILLPEEVLGTASLILWALFLIVTVKYVAILLRMDNNGEGGILSLMALARK
ncbi:KUP/HAK/KT family potassium transporter, partial [uncultured Methylobacterium sp.]|uniref:KUP/HAK/KT family potassium transporter n=1 Tax=uncultured Methylobacterium sp. TaxID=157278 RepID=UPI0035C9C1DC